MSERTPLAPEVEAKQHELFEAALRDCKLPNELSPEQVIEALRFPSHFPSVVHFLKKLAQDPRLTYTTERQAKHQFTAESERAIFTLEYSAREAFQPKPSIEVHQPPSKRLFAACLAHARDKGPVFASQLYFVMQDIVKPALGYEYNLQPIQGVVEPSLQRSLRKLFSNEPDLNLEQYGDFNLLLKFITTHWSVFEAAYFVGADKVTHESTQLAQGMNGVAIPLIETYLQDLAAIGSPIDLESARLEKKKLQNPNVEAFPRAQETHITRRFTELFVELDITNPSAVATAFGLDAPPAQAECQMLQVRFAPIEALLLCFMNQQNQPLARSLMGHCHPDLPTRATDYISFAAKNQSDAIKDLDVINLETSTLREIMTATFQQLQHAKVRSFGAAQALLVSWSELKNQAQHHDTPNKLYQQKADALEMLMQHAILLISDPTYSEKFGLQAITENN